MTPQGIKEFLQKQKIIVFKNKVFDESYIRSLLPKFIFVERSKVRELSKLDNKQFSELKPSPKPIIKMELIIDEYYTGGFIAGYGIRKKREPVLLFYKRDPDKDMAMLELLKMILETKIKTPKEIYPQKVLIL